MEVGIPGPPNDESTQGFFLIASDFVAKEDENKKAATEIKSPLINGQRHEFECFDFQYFFGPESNGVTLTVAMIPKDEDDYKLLWIVKDSDVQKGTWSKGQLEIHGIEEMDYKVYNTILSHNSF